MNSQQKTHCSDDIGAAGMFSWMFSECSLSVLWVFSVCSLCDLRVFSVWSLCDLWVFSGWSLSDFWVTVGCQSVFWVALMISSSIGHWTENCYTGVGPTITITMILLNNKNINRLEYPLLMMFLNNMEATSAFRFTIMKSLNNNNNNNHR